MSYIVQRQDRFYVVAYDGLDPLTGGNGDDGTPSATTARSRSGRRPTRRRPTPAPARARRTDHARRVPHRTWLPHKRRHVRATTAYRYAWFVDHYINPAIGDVPLRRLRADHLDDLYERLATTGGRHGDRSRAQDHRTRST